MKCSRIIRILLLCSLSLSPLALAEPDVRVLGLFSDKAVLEIAGRRAVLAVGETGPQGVRLVAADSHRAVLEIGGVRREAGLDGRVSASKPAAPASEVQVWRNPQGMFTTVGSINGLPVSFMVDTGATLVALNASEARRLGIDYRVSGSPASVVTASGVEQAWSVMLERVKIGELELRNVGAVVMQGAYPSIALLGMSYLGRLEISNSGQLMTLRKKY
jgi:aspartyl protease family protein